jgi:ubiquinone/menaquinone biosynthesis C-methylase UbiE
MDSNVRFTTAPSPEGRTAPAPLAHDVCPAWLAPMLDNPVRRWLAAPGRITRDYLREGMTVVDIGCGPAAMLSDFAAGVGATGEVVCVDIQRAMLERVARKAVRAGIADRVRLHQCGPDALGLEPSIADLAVAFWMLHEVPDEGRLLAEVRACLKPGGRFLLVEPGVHVSQAKFAASLEQAQTVGFSIEDRPRFPISHAALLTTA